MKEILFYEDMDKKNPKNKMIKDFLIINCTGQK
jgi:hypothetical protein